MPLPSAQAAHVSPAAHWHIYPWPAPAWIESAVKNPAMGIGTLALAQALADAHFEVPSGKRAVEVGVLFVLSLGLLAAMADRIKEREQVPMVFVMFNNLGHGACWWRCCRNRRRRTCS